MTSERDFDRIARAWLALGPDEAPERALSAVRDAIETIPQVRRTGPEPFWKPASMNRWQILAAAAALVALAAAAFALAGGPAPGPAPTSSAPSPSASRTDLVPEALWFRWSGGHRDVTGIDEKAGATLLFTSDGFSVGQVNDLGLRGLDSAGRTTVDGRLQLTSRVDDADCARDDLGVYDWSVSASGRTLTLTAIEDECATRKAAVPGVWWREECKDPSPDAACLGALDAGAYASEFVDPSIPLDGPWGPNFGAVTFTVPEGWASSGDWPNTYYLVPSDTYGLPDPELPSAARREIGLYAHPALAAQNAACSAQEADPPAASVATIVAGLRRLPSVVVSEPTSIDVDGRPGQWLDVAVAPGWTSSCPGESQPVAIPLTQIGARGDGPDGWVYGLASGDRARFVLIELADDNVVLVAIFVGAGTEFDGFVAEAMPIVESFGFE